MVEHFVRLSAAYIAAELERYVLHNIYLLSSSTDSWPLCYLNTASLDILNLTGRMIFRTLRDCVLVADSVSLHQPVLERIDAKSDRHQEDIRSCESVA